MVKPKPAKRGSYKIPSIYPLPDWLRLHQKIRVSEAARLNAMHEDTFRKEHADKIVKVTDRLEAVELGTAIAIGKPKPKTDAA
jgi:hypothetical protein